MPSASTTHFLADSGVRNTDSVGLLLPDDICSCVRVAIVAFVAIVFGDGAKAEHWC